MVFCRIVHVKDIDFFYIAQGVEIESATEGVTIVGENQLH